MPGKGKKNPKKKAVKKAPVFAKKKSKAGTPVKAAAAPLVLEQILETIPGGVVHVLISGSIATANREACRILGLSFDQLTRRFTVDFATETFHEDGRLCDPTDYPVTKALMTGKPQPPKTIGIRHPDGTMAWAVFRAMPLFDNDGEVTGAVVTFIDISSEKEKENSLKQSEASMRSLLEHMPLYLATYAPDGRILSVNKSNDLISREEILQSTVFDFFPPETHEDLRRRIARVIQNGEKEEFESTNYIKGNKFQFKHVMWPHYVGRKVAGVNILADDITEKRSLYEALEFQATHDSITGLYNRYHFEKSIRDSIANAKSTGLHHAFLYLDLDQFKIINDTCGHLAGDELLLALAARMKSRLKPMMELSRLGGDEFGILIRNTDLKRAVEAAEDMRQLIADYAFKWEGRTFHVTASIGVSLIDRKSQDFSELLQQADFACYSSKDGGRNRVSVFHPEDRNIALRKTDMIQLAGINRAFELDRFRLYFQKIIPLQSPNHGIGVEILARMLDDDGNLIMPMNFIMTAERYDLMSRIDYWVVSNTIRFFENNPEQLEEVAFVTINLSATSLGNREFLRDLVGLLQSKRFPPDKILFELTETAAISRIESTVEFMNHLRSLGFSFILDDFGTGVSSFGYLKSLPVSAVKIDGIFIINIDKDESDMLMVKAMQTLCSSLHKTTIAEFIETDGALNTVKATGLDYGQGYFLHRPEPLEHLPEAIRVKV